MTTIYVEGNSFPNIYGGHTPCQYGYISQITKTTPEMDRRWPWMKGSWMLSNGRGYSEYYDNEKMAKDAARAMWPDCTFKTSDEYREESE